ncbi:MAG TPA: lipopolysaccharide assembly protein LapA domain-containing protein [Candidatus Dormibacteraeota bacterium]
MSYLWQRFIHFLIAVIFLAIGIGLTVFVYSNTTSVNIDWWQLHFTNVPLGMVALIPLLLGVVLGYLYHVPSGLHDFSQSMRKSRRIHELEQQNKALQHQVDSLLAMPDDTRPAAKPELAPAAPVAPVAPVNAPAAAQAVPAPGAPAAHATKTRAVHEPAKAHEAAKPHPSAEHPKPAPSA